MGPRADYMLFNWKGRCENKLRLSVNTKIFLSKYSVQVGNWAEGFHSVLTFSEEHEIKKEGSILRPGK